QAAPQVVRGRLQAAQPRLVRQEAVRLVGEDEQLDVHLLLAQVHHETDTFREGHLRVVVAVNHQDGRAPGLDRGDRGRVAGELRRVAAGQRVVAGLEVADDDVPVVDAVDVHAGGEQVGGAGQAERGQVAAVRAAPQPDAVRIDVGPPPQV